MMKNESRNELLWKRPDNVPYPKVWHRFEAVSKTNGCKHKIQIQDIPGDRFEECLDFTETHFDHYEPLCRAIELWKDPESVATFRTMKRKYLEQKISLMAVIGEDKAQSKSEIIGILLLGVESKNDPPPKKVMANKLSKVFDFLEYIQNAFDPFQLLQSDHYVYHFGVSLAPKYRGLGVGYELELQSSFVGKACGIRGSSIVFTSTYAQRFYEKLGCTLINEVRYDEFKDENGEVIIPNLDGLSAIFVIWKYA